MRTLRLSIWFFFFAALRASSRPGLDDFGSSRGATYIGDYLGVLTVCPDIANRAVTAVQPLRTGGLGGWCATERRKNRTKERSYFSHQNNLPVMRQSTNCHLLWLLICLTLMPQVNCQTSRRERWYSRVVFIPAKRLTLRFRAAPLSAHAICVSSSSSSSSSPANFCLFVLLPFDWSWLSLRSLGILPSFNARSRRVISSRVVAFASAALIFSWSSLVMVSVGTFDFKGRGTPSPGSKVEDFVAAIDSASADGAPDLPTNSFFASSLSWYSQGHKYGW